MIKLTNTLDSNKLNEAFRNYDVEQVICSLGSDSLSDVRIAKKFMAALRQSSCLAIQVEDKTSEEHRDQLIEKCRELLVQCPDENIKSDFENHVEDAQCAEIGYREVFRYLHTAEISNRLPAEQAWGIICRAENEINLVISQCDDELTKCVADENTPFDPRQLKITGEDGTSIRPDAAINGFVQHTGEVLITLAYKHRWFDKKTGAIVIPPEAAVNKEITYQAGSFYLAASQWSRLEKAWDRSRLFGARLGIHNQELRIAQGGARLYDVLGSTAAEKLELSDRIATQRLEQVFFQRQINIDRNLHDEVQPKTVVSESKNKDEPVSLSERVALDVLDSNFHLSVHDKSTVVSGLSLKTWIRGYAHYELLAKDSAENRMLTCLRLSEKELLDGFVAIGLSKAEAKTFVRLTTFGQGATDLFDTPLLKVSDNSYCFFAAAYFAPVLGMIVLSRISALNRRRDEEGKAANDCTFEGKGTAFEDRIVKIFRESEIPAHGFKYKVEGTEYDCDAAVLIDETLFVFECKNRSIPMGHIPSLYYFKLALDKAQAQVKRIAQQFTDNPSLVHNQFGAEVQWQRIVPVVLHALPWSSGCIDGVYFYDGSALSNLLREGVVRLVAESKIDIHTVLRRHGYQLRKGEAPTPEELKSEMGKPKQVRLHEIGWKDELKPIQISDEMVFAFPEWSQRTVTLEEQMLALGSSPEEAAAMAKDLTKDTSAVVSGIRDGLKGTRRKTKVGRNQKCPCGSDKKYKKCCGY